MDGRWRRLIYRPPNGDRQNLEEVLFE